MVALARRENAGRWPSLLDLLEAPLHALGTLPGHSIRFEEFVRNSHYVVRAELPGVDPDEDIEVTVMSGMLTIQAKREEEVRDYHRNEFRYGYFARSIPLPLGADESSLRATYQYGILEITVKLTEPKQSSQRVPIERTEKAERAIERAERAKKV